MTNEADEEIATEALSSDKCQQRRIPVCIIALCVAVILLHLLSLVVIWALPNAGVPSSQSRAPHQPEPQSPSLPLPFMVPEGPDLASRTMNLMPPPAYPPWPPPLTPPAPPPKRPQPRSPPPVKGNFQFYTGFPFYRLGDMIAIRSEREEEGGKAYHLQHFPSSIASRYMRATDDENNFGALTAIVRSMQVAIRPPPPDAVVVQVRIGDVLEAAWTQTLDYTPHQLLSMDHEICVSYVANFGDAHRNCYVRNLAYYERQVSKLPSHVKRAILCAASHLDLESFSRSSAYLRGLRDWFLSKGMTVDLRIGKQPDEDVWFIAHAQFFIQGGGGFSMLLGNLVHSMGGAVMYDYLPPHAPPPSPPPPTPPGTICRWWCEEHTKPWEAKCGFVQCNGCAACQS